MELAELLVVGLDAAGEDVVVPAVDGEAAVEDGGGDGRLGFEVGELGDDVAADEGGEFGVFAFFGAGGLLVGKGAFDVIEPAAGARQIFEAFLVEGGFEGAAVGVAAEDDVADVEHFDGVLDGGGDAVVAFAGGGDNVAGVAGDEEVAGIGTEDEVGDDAGVGAGDEEPAGALAVGEQLVLLPADGEDLVEEVLMALKKLFHGGDPLCELSSCGKIVLLDYVRPGQNRLRRKAGVAKLCRFREVSRG